MKYSNTFYTDNVWLFSSTNIHTTNLYKIHSHEQLCAHTRPIIHSISHMKQTIRKGKKNLNYLDEFLGLKEALEMFHLPNAHDQQDTELS